MKALILSCNTGQGHNSVSGAITKALEKRGIECDTKDALGFVSEWASKTVCEWHTRLYRYFPKASGSGYSFIEQHPELFDSRSPVHMLLRLGVDKLYACISEGKYSIVICPHVISALMITDLMKQYPEVSLRTCFIATDYTCSPMTEESDLDFYFIPAGFLIEDFEEINIPREKICVIDGIPVRPEFYINTDKSEAKKGQGIPDDCVHVLMMFGSMGCGNMPRLTELISEKLPEKSILTVVCGTNENVYKKLSKDFDGIKNVRILGYVKDIPELMSSADLFITKPGGLSTAEASVKRLPMLLDNAVSGCEQYNLDYFCKIGSAVTAEGEENIAELCLELISNPDKLRRMHESNPERRNSAEQLVEKLLDGYEPGETAKVIENNFRYWRKRCHLTQNELSRMLGIPLSTIKSWESGASSPPQYIERMFISELKRIERRMKRESEE